MPVDKIPLGTPMVCESCLTVAYFPGDLIVSMLPVELACPHCDAIVRFDSLPVLPKVIPTSGVQKYWSATGLRADDANEPETAFATREKSIRTLLSGLMQECGMLLSEIKELERAFMAEFTEQHRLATMYKNCWDASKICDFITSPISAIPVECLLPNMSKNSKLILSPNFFTPKLGLQIPCFGSMRAEITNPYIRLAMPVTTGIAASLDIEPTPRISVGDNVIFGDDSIKDITGTDDIIESHDGASAVRIIDSRAARQWLASHGVPSWKKVRIEQTDLVRRIDDYIDTVHGAAKLDSQDIKNDVLAWEKFKENGRLGIFWKDSHAATKCCYRLTKRIDGRKIIIRGEGEPTTDRWRDSFGLAGSLIDHSYVMIDNFDTFMPEMMNRIPVVIIDMISKPDFRIVDYVFNYRGFVILLHDDPLMDFTSSAAMASACYGLVNCVMLDQEDVTVNRKDFSDLSKSMIDSISKLVRGGG